MARGSARRVPLKLLALAAMLIPLFLLNRQSELPSTERTEGAILWVLCLAPAVLYVFSRPRRRTPIPIFPLIGVMFALYYALPALMGAVNLAYNPKQTRIPLLDPQTQFSGAVDLALGGWAMALLGYIVLPLFYRPRLRPEKPWPVRSLGPWLVLMVAGGLVAELARAVISLPSWANGAVAFIATLSRFAIGMLLALRARQQLRPREKLALMIGVPAELTLLLSSGSIASIFLFVLFLILAQHVGGGYVRIRWLIFGVAAAIPVVAIKGVLGEYRQQAWFSEAHLGVAGRTALIGSLLGDEVQTNGVVATVEHGWSAVVIRSATLDLFADVVQRTPRDIPYWGGQTYLSLVGLAIPRFLWPSKPTKALGQDFGHRYEFLDVRDNYTSINFPFLSEFYANFGAMGVILGMFLTGVIYRALDLLLNVPGQSTIRSLVGLSILLPLLNIESDFSLVFGGLFLNAVAFHLVLRFLRKRIAAAAPRGRHSSARIAVGSPESHPVS